MLKKVSRLILILFSLIASGQVHTQKEVNNQGQSWLSINTNLKFNEQWSLLTDFHVRRNDFTSQDSFYFIRGGVGYIPNSKILFGCTFNSLTNDFAHIC